MARNFTDYFTRRIDEEEVAAAAAAHPDVKARHAEFAAVYRRRVAKTDDRDDYDGLFPA